MRNCRRLPDHKTKASQGNRSMSRSDSEVAVVFLLGLSPGGRPYDRRGGGISVRNEPLWASRYCPDPPALTGESARVSARLCLPSCYGLNLCRQLSSQAWPPEPSVNSITLPTRVTLAG